MGILWANAGGRTWLGKRGWASIIAGPRLPRPPIILSGMLSRTLTAAKVTAAVRANRFHGIGWLLLVVACWSTSAVAEDAAGPQDESERRSEIRFFENHIRPVLVEHCYSCHSAQAKIVRGGLWLDSREAMLRGGDSGPAIVPGDAEESLIVSALRHESFEMPPRKQLGEVVVQQFTRWISRGAVDPREETPEFNRDRIDPIAAREHWAFQPVTNPAAPAFDDPELQRWVANPIDAFVLEGLCDKGWRPAEPADKYTLIRRVTFDLIGLPPTPAEIEAFLEDDSPDSYQRLVDRLLASPHYGQRWGRHWLDLVRYADTNGADENHNMPDAWRYRDWVIQSMNRDQPLDEFIVHQLAGDMLTAGVDEATHGELLAATGMLVIGPKMLAEQDKEKMRIDIIDEQIDTVSRTLMGLTIACARCHDHKFDPIQSEDYYALAGIFASTRTMLNESFVSRWMERDLPSARIDALRKQHQLKIDAAKSALQELTDQANAEVLAKLDTTTLPEAPDNHYPKQTAEAITQAKKELQTVELAMPKYELVMAVEEQPCVDLHVHLRGNHLKQGDVAIPRGVPKRIAQVNPFPGIDDGGSGRMELAKWLTDGQHVLTGRVMANRLWMWHLGRPIVASPSNFGLQCPKPVHAKLLDWMAHRLVEDGWSIKRMHRLIMTSNTYQMTSRVDTYTQQDPDNQFLWRQNRRRLEVEPLRDAILAAGNSLERTFDGPSEDAKSNRRTVYLTINRAALLDLLSTFDYVEPANHIEQRSVTTVPSQALFLMNSPLVHSQAERLAKQVLQSESDRESRITRLWMKLFGQPPTHQQVKLAGDFLQAVDESDSAQADSTQADSIKTWASLCRTLIAGSQFIYVE